MTEIATRDESNCRNRMTAARFPVHKTLDEFNLDESSIPKASHDYLVTLDWIDRADNLCLVGPAGTGKTHCETKFTGSTRTRTRVVPVMTRDPKTHSPHRVLGGLALDMSVASPVPARIPLMLA